MQEIDKVIAISIQKSLFNSLIDTDSDHQWVDLDDLIENEELYKYIQEFDKDIIKQLENKDADCLIIYKGY